MFGGEGGFAPGGVDQGRALEASFKEFLNRPENQTLVEKHQRREVKQAIQLQEKQRALEFRDTVLASEQEAQKAIAPFLRNRVLRRIIQTFANDPDGDFGKWATNPRVIEMLTQAQRLMDEGRLTEQDAEEHMLRQLKDPKNEHHDDFIAKTKQVARLPTDQLVQALNEHLTERRRGNTEYKAGNYKEALKYYARAQAVIELVKGLSRADQAEVDVNKTTIYLNIAAVYMAMSEFSTAVAFCDKALAIDAHSIKAMARKVRADIGRHEYDKARAGIALLKSNSSCPAAEVTALSVLLSTTKKADQQHERQTFAGMFDRTG